LCRYRSRSSKFNLGVTVVITIIDITDLLDFDDLAILNAVGTCRYLVKVDGMPSEEHEPLRFGERYKTGLIE
jgi:hypothetical protein